MGIDYQALEEQRSLRIAKLQNDTLPREERVNMIVINEWEEIHQHHPLIPGWIRMLDQISAPYQIQAHRKHRLQLFTQRPNYFQFKCRDCDTHFVISRSVMASTFFAGWEHQNMKRRRDGF